MSVSKEYIDSERARIERIRAAARELWKWRRRNPTFDRDHLVRDVVRSLFDKMNKAEAQLKEKIK